MYTRFIQNKRLWNERILYCVQFGNTENKAERNAAYNGPVRTYCAHNHLQVPRMRRRPSHARPPRLYLSLRPLHFPLHKKTKEIRAGTKMCTGTVCWPRSSPALPVWARRKERRKDSRDIHPRLTLRAPQQDRCRDGAYIHPHVPHPRSTQSVRPKETAAGHPHLVLPPPVTQ
jgi:hypothetical protein